MSARITKKDLEASVRAINRRLGFSDPQWDTVGAIRLDGAYGGYSVLVNTAGGVRELLHGHHPVREVHRFLAGMIEGLNLR